MSLPNYLSAIKSAGIYRFVWDKSEIEGVDAETLRLVVGYSEKGPFNTPVYVKSATDFKTIFGGISRKLEKRGVFFHRLALQALLSGPIIALNLKKFSNVEGKDEVQGITMDASGSVVYREDIYDSENPDLVLHYSDIKNIPVEGIYNKVRFWNLSPETARESYASIAGSTKYISIFSADDSSTSKSFIIRGYKPTGFDITIKQWYSNMGEEMPDIYKPIEETLLNQYFAEIYVFEGEFTSAMAKSKELNRYFDVNEDTESGVQTVYLKPYILNAFGEKTDTLATLAADKNSNFVKMYRGITLPEFKDNNNNYISLNLVFNNDTYLHKMMMDFNVELIDNLDPDDADISAPVLIQCLNTAGWYDENLAGYNGDTPRGLQMCMDYVYDNVNTTNNVPIEYYELPTNINILGNENLVPDADIMLTIGRKVYNGSDIESVQGGDVQDYESRAKEGFVAQTTPLTGSNLPYVMTSSTNSIHIYDDTKADVSDITYQNSTDPTESHKIKELFTMYSITDFEMLEGTNMVGTNGSDVLFLDNGTPLKYTYYSNEDLKGFLAQIINTAYSTSITIDTLKINNLYIDANDSTKTLMDGKYTEDGDSTKHNITVELLTDFSQINIASSSWTNSTKKTIQDLSAVYEVWDGEEKDVDEIHNIYCYFYDFVNTTWKAMYFVNAEEDNCFTATIWANDTYTLQYVTMSVSSDSKNGGDVQFLTMNKCYTDDPETTVPQLIEAYDNRSNIPSWISPTDDSNPEGVKEIFTIYTDAFVNYGLQVGDKFLAREGKVATLLSIEEIYHNTEASMVPMVKYTFNEPLSLMCLEFDDDDNFYNGNESYQLILTKLVNPFGIALTASQQFTYLKGFEYSNPRPASNSQYDKLQWQWSILDTLTEYRGLRTGLTEKKDIDYRYIIDTFESFIEPECKGRLSLLAKEKDSCLALLNFPAIETFRKCTYTSFTDDKGQLDIKYIAEGGNSRKTMSMKFSLPSETNGASWCSFNTCVVLSDGTVKTTIPAAALVSNNFMEKYVSRQPYYIVAGPNYGRIVDYQLVGPDFNFGRADLDVLEPFGVNCMVYVPRIGTYINSNQTAKQNPVTALSKINIRELVIYLQDEIEKLLQSYQWEFNNQTLRDVIKTKADTICENVKNNGGIYEYLNVCDSSNNPPEVIDNEMIVLSTSIEGARGAGKMVQELTLYKTGGLTALINNG